MKKMKSIVFGISMCLGWSAKIYAQDPVNTYSIQGFWSPPAPRFSPVVNLNETITFRVRAAKAAKVDLLFGEWNIKPQAMKKEDNEVWSITIGPVQPGIYAYNFSIDGVQSIDRVNPDTKIGTEIYSSIVEVHGNTPRIDEIQNVSHGVIAVHRYLSTPLKTIRSVSIYIPPQYLSEPNRSFPVLYLRHGGGDNESSWTQTSGRADVILENLIAQEKAVPMIVVMPNGLTDGSWSGGSTPEGLKTLETELMKDIVPLVESTYRTLKGSANRAIAGLSMGGGQSFVIGLRNPDTFAWVGDFSAGLMSDKDFKIEQVLPNLLPSNQLNSKIRLLWIGCGTDDPRYPGHLALRRMLNDKGIKNEFHSDKGGHEWSVWRNQLAGFYQEIFKTTSIK